MPLFTTPEVELHYEIYGPRQGVPLVLAHGLGLTAAMWSEQRPLSQHHPLILWEARGHGRSSLSSSNTYGLGASAQDLNNLLEYLGVRRAVVGGLSLGGGTAVRFALEYPHIVTRLVVCDAATALPLELSEERLSAQSAFIHAAQVGDMERLARSMLEASSNFCLRAKEDAIRDHVIDMFRNVQPHAYVQTLLSLREPSFQLEDLGTLSCPTLIMVGEKDAVKPVCERLHSIVKGSSYTVLSNAGHLSNIDSPKRFNSTLLNFLR